MPNGLVLHCGNALASRAEIAVTGCPSPTESWQPVHHWVFLELVILKLEELGYEVGEEALSLNEDHSRMFGVMEIQMADQPEDYSMVIGLRNSHDKMFALGIIVGTKVFVCDNLSFSAEIKVVRKHTPNILNELEAKIAEALGQLPEANRRQNERIAAYKNVSISEDRVAHYFIDVVKRGVVSPSKITRLWDEFDQPNHYVFTDRTLWSAFNAVTEVLKPPEDPERPGHGKGGVAIFDNPRRTLVLHDISDYYADIARSSDILVSVDPQSVHNLDNLTNNPL